MKMSIEVLAGLCVLGILGVFLNPTHILMPETIHTMLLVGLVLGFLAFVSLIWREKANDEREAVHIYKSARISFFTGAAILVVAIVIQTTMHEIDPWLLCALSGMVVAKLLSRFFHSIKN